MTYIKNIVNCSFHVNNIFRKRIIYFCAYPIQKKSKEENRKTHMAKWKTSDFVVFVKMNNKSLVSLWTSCLDSTNNNHG